LAIWKCFPAKSTRRCSGFEQQSHDLRVLLRMSRGARSWGTGRPKAWPRRRASRRPGRSRPARREMIDRRERLGEQPRVAVRDAVHALPAGLASCPSRPRSAWRSPRSNPCRRRAAAILEVVGDREPAKPLASANFHSLRISSSGPPMWPMCIPNFMSSRSSRAAPDDAPGPIIRPSASLGERGPLKTAHLLRWRPRPPRPVARLRRIAPWRRTGGGVALLDRMRPRAIPSPTRRSGPCSTRARWRR